MKTLNNKLRQSQDIADAVNKEIQKNIDNKYWRKCSELKLDPNLQKHYLPINYVKSASSASTPVRIILDPSQKGKNSISLNHCEASGSSQIGDLKGCLLRFRTSQTVALGDIAKFFNSFGLTDEDMSLRRILIPEKGFGQKAEDMKLEEYALTVMGFGDKASPILATIGKMKHMKAFIDETDEELKESVTRTLTTQAYVDDCFANCPYGEDIKKITNAVDKILTKGNMSIKQWIYESNTETTKYLGYLWKPNEDSMHVKCWFNSGKKIRGENIEDNLDLDNVTLLSKSFSRRKVLRIQGQFFDPLLILSPIVVKIRLLFQKVCMEQEDIDWDSPLKEELQDAVVDLYKDLAQYKDFDFRRSVIPREMAGHKPRCELITFTDGSLSAYAACSYLRFKQGNQIFSNLLVSTVKISGARKLTPPRSELLGAHAGVQLALQVKKEISDNVEITSVTYITDSRVILAQLKLKSASFEVFTGSRIAFIQDHSADSRWLWCPGKDNPADLPTRNLTTYEEVTSEKWMNGGFLLKEEKDWPTKSLSEADLETMKPTKNALYTAKMLVRATQAMENEEQITETNFSSLLKRHRSFQKVINIISYMLKLRYTNLPFADLNEKAVNIVIQDSTPMTEQKFKKKKFSQGEKIYRDGKMYLRTVSYTHLTLPTNREV